MDDINKRIIGYNNNKRQADIMRNRNNAEIRDKELEYLDGMQAAN